MKTKIGRSTVKIKLTESAVPPWLDGLHHLGLHLCLFFFVSFDFDKDFVFVLLKTSLFQSPSFFSPLSCNHLLRLVCRLLHYYLFHCFLCSCLHWLFCLLLCGLKSNQTLVDELLKWGLPTALCTVSRLYLICNKNSMNKTFPGDYEWPKIHYRSRSSSSVDRCL